MRKVVILLICCFITSLNISLLADDSIPPAKELQDVVVYGERSWIENGVINVIPSKKDKKLSNSPASLIKVMNLPFLQEKDGVITNMNGEEVQIFINGEKANDIDIAAFWPMEVKRVQYLENPGDPTYEGARYALNFIVDKYEVGGVTRVDWFQRFPNWGGPEVASKLVYKKMTYGAMVWFRNSRDHRSSMTGETKYKDLYYNGNYYDEITETEDRHSYERNEYLNAAINAKYTGKNCRITHTLSFNWNHNPGSGSNSTDIWSDNLFGSSVSKSGSTGRSISPQFSGNYWFKLSDKWFLAGKTLYSYGESKSSYMSKFGDSDAISNHTEERVNTAKLTVKPTFMPSPKWIFQMIFSSGFDWFSTRYSGSTDARHRQSRQDLSMSGMAFWYPSSKLSLSLNAGVVANRWQIGEVREHTVSPVFSLWTGFNPSRKWSLSGIIKIHRFAPSASESNPVLVKNTDLMWVMGNPHLKTTLEWDNYVYTTYIPCNWLSISLGMGYDKLFNRVIGVYKPASPELGGLIKENVSAAPQDIINASVTFAGSFLNNKLNVKINPSWRYDHIRGVYSTDFNYLTFRGGIDYRAGNFMFELEYEGPSKSMNLGGMGKDWWDDRWNFRMTYGTGDVYVQLRLENMFNNKWKKWEKFNSPYYETNRHTLQTGRAFVVNVTYTFGYGKKVDRSIEVEGPASVKTSVIN